MTIFLFQLTLELRSGDPQVLNFKRRKICKERRLPASGLVSSNPTTVEDVNETNQSLLLASVSPTMFVAMGAASASVLLVAVLVAAVYLRRMKKRGRPLREEGGSLRSSMHLHSEAEYLEKQSFGGQAASTKMSSSDSYATLASFTQVNLSLKNKNTFSFSFVPYSILYNVI